MRWSWRNLAGTTAVFVVLGHCSAAAADDVDAEPLRRGAEAYEHIFAWGTQVMATGTFAVGAGGNGGDGGKGGTGRAGTTGEAGSDLYGAQTCGVVKDSSGMPHCVITENAGSFDPSKWIPTVKGSAGTTGGAGGAGGQGGGGSGGSSVCFFQGGGGIVSGATSSCTLATAGAGGNGGGGISQGQDGVAAVSLSGP